jgi:hypothetical protein
MRGLKKTKKILRIYTTPAEIRTGHLPDTCQPAGLVRVIWMCLILTSSSQSHGSLNSRSADFESRTGDKFSLFFYVNLGKCLDTVSGGSQLFPSRSFPIRYLSIIPSGCKTCFRYLFDAIKLVFPYVLSQVPWSILRLCEPLHLLVFNPSLSDYRRVLDWWSDLSDFPIQRVTALYNSLLHTHTHISAHSHIFTSRCSVATSNGGTISGLSYQLLTVTARN